MKIARPRANAVLIYTSQDLSIPVQHSPFSSEDATLFLCVDHQNSNFDAIVYLVTCVGLPAAVRIEHTGGASPVQLGLTLQVCQRGNGSSSSCVIYDSPPCNTSFLFALSGAKLGVLSFLLELDPWCRVEDLLISALCRLPSADYRVPLHQNLATTLFITASGRGGESKRDSVTLCATR